ncbi:MAG: hypothetical protein IIZ39_05930 [Blautia sp.]|nr:hypothetical protein [Blautia sp.]
MEKKRNIKKKRPDEKEESEEKEGQEERKGQKEREGKEKREGKEEKEEEKEGEREGKEKKIRKEREKEEKRGLALLFFLVYPFRMGFFNQDSTKRDRTFDQHDGHRKAGLPTGKALRKRVPFDCPGHRLGGIRCVPNTVRQPPVPFRHRG